MAHEIARLIDGKFIAPDMVVPRRDNGPQLVECQSNELPDLAGAVDHLREAISGMTPDDVSMTFTTEQTGDKRRSSFQFRAYRR